MTKPNEHGVFTEECCEIVSYVSPSGGRVRVRLAQYKGSWFSGLCVDLLECGRSSPASIHSTKHPSRESAYSDQISEIKEYCLKQTGSYPPREKRVKQSKEIIAWINQQSQTSLF